MSIFDFPDQSVRRGPEFWMDRVKDSISLTSPSGKQYTAKWAGDSIDKNKRLQVSGYLGAKFSHIRDLGIDSATHPISVYFDGNDCDLISNKFWNTLDEDGQWGILHPSMGFKSYQLVSAKMYNEYIESGNCVKLDLQWIDPKNKESKDSGIKLGSMSDHARLSFEQDTAMSFVEKMSLASDALRKNCNNVSNIVAGTMDKYLGPIAAISDFAFNAYVDVKRMITDIELSTEFQAMALCGQFQNLIEYAILSTNDFVDKRNDACNSLINDTIKLATYTSGNGRTISSITKDQFGINKAAIIELVSLSCFSGLCQIASSCNIESQNQSKNMIDNLLAKSEYILKELEKIQSVFSSETVDNNFIIADTSIKSMESLLSATLKYLLYTSTKYGVVKSVIISEPIHTLTFYLKTYKRKDGFEKFCDNNKLNFEEIIYLPYGKEVFI